VLFDVLVCSRGRKEITLARPPVSPQVKAPGPTLQQPAIYSQQLLSQPSLQFQPGHLPMQQQWQVPPQMQNQAPVPISMPVMTGPTPVQVPMITPRLVPIAPSTQAPAPSHVDFPGQIVINGEIYVPAYLLIDALRSQSIRQQQPLLQPAPPPPVEYFAATMPSAAEVAASPKEPMQPRVPPPIVTKKAEELARSWVRQMPLHFVPKAAHKRKQQEYDQKRATSSTHKVAPKKRPRGADNPPVDVDEWEGDEEQDDWGPWKHKWDPAEEAQSEEGTDREEEEVKSPKWFKSNQCNTKDCVFSCSLANNNLTTLCYLCKNLEIH
jgi:hypothetical protein